MGSGWGEVLGEALSIVAEQPLPQLREALPPGGKAAALTPVENSGQHCPPERGQCAEKGMEAEKSAPEMLLSNLIGASYRSAATKKVGRHAHHSSDFAEKQADKGSGIQHQHKESRHGGAASRIW